MERLEVLKKYTDLTTNLKGFNVCRRLVNLIKSGWDMARQVNALVVKDNSNQLYLIKVRPGYELILNKEFLCISDEDFKDAWTRIEEYKILGEIDVVGRYVIYELPNIIIDRDISGEFFIREL